MTALLRTPVRRGTVAALATPGWTGAGVGVGTRVGGGAVPTPVARPPRAASRRRRPPAAPEPVRAPEPAPHVALFLPNVGGGGAERVVLNLAGGLADAGYRVDLVLASAEGSYLETVPAGVEIVDLGAARTMSALPRLSTYLRRQRPDALLSALSHANVVAVWASRLAGFHGPVVVAAHAHPGMLPDGLVARLRRALVRDAYRQATRVVAVSRGLKDAWAEQLALPDDTFEVIYNPVVTPQTRAASAQRVEHPFFERPPVVVAVGRLIPVKNFANLVRALALVRRGGQPDARLIILGEGPQRAELEALAEELGVSGALSLPGFAENPHGYLARADLFVLSSDWEALPTALIEALAAGAPVVSTDCPAGPREILADGELGELVPVGDSRSLAAAMLRALSRGRRSVDPAWLEPFTLERAVSEYVQAMGVAP